MMSFIFSFLVIVLCFRSVMASRATFAIEDQYGQMSIDDPNQGGIEDDNVIL